MIEWTKLAGRVWQILNNQEEKVASINRDEIEYLDYRLLEWYANAPKIKPDDTNLDPLFLEAVLRTRKYYLRNLIYRPVLQSPARIEANRPYVALAMQVSKKSIEALSELYRTTKLVQSHPVFFKHFILTAFGNLLPGVVNAPKEIWNDVREEFNLALNLIKLLSARSDPLLRLWNRLAYLQAELIPFDMPGFRDHSAEDQLDSKWDNLSANDSLPAFSDSLVQPSKPKSPGRSSVEGSRARDEFLGLFNASLSPDFFQYFPYMDI